MQVYQYNSKGYYVAKTTAHKGFFPNNTTDIMPIFKEGFIPKWNGSDWEQVENHIGTKGWLNNEEFEVVEYGVLPEGFSLEAPEKTLEDLIKLKLLEFYSHEKNYREEATIEVDGKFFSISENAKINLSATSIMAMAGADCIYFQKNGDSKTYAPDEFIALAMQIAQGIGAAETRYYTLETQIKNVNTKEELEAIVWAS